MKHFWLIRHAKTAWPEPGQADFERELKKRGHRDGKQMADYYARSLANDAERADWIICSAARRTQQTAEYVATGFAVPQQQVIAQPALYNSTPDTLLDALRETPLTARCVAVIAHNPGMTWLVNQLAGDELSLDNVPTFGSALFRSDVDDWVDVGRAELIRFMTPKLLREGADTTQPDAQ